MLCNPDASANLPSTRHVCINAFRSGFLVASAPHQSVAIKSCPISSISEGTTLNSTYQYTSCVCDSGPDMSEWKDILEGHPADIPTSRDEVTRHLALLESERCRLEKTSEVLRKLLDTVDVQREKVYQMAVIYDPEFAPVNRLPMEVLQEVFLSCCPPDEEQDKDLWMLERVSRKWRRAALGCPKLWSHIHVSSDSLRSYNARDPLGMTDLWVKRSAECELKVTFGHFYFWDSNPSLHFSIFSLLLEHCHRWREFSLNIRFNPEIVTALENMRGRFLSLQHLEVQCFSLGDDGDDDITATQAFSGTMNLLKIHLYGDDFFRVNVASSSITSLLVWSSKYLDNLALPNLRELVVSEENRSEGGDDIFSKLLRFVQRSRCTNLKSLDVYHQNAAARVSGNVEEIFRLLPSLESLDIYLDHEVAHRRALSCLLVSYTQEPLPTCVAMRSLHLLPNLRKLGIILPSITEGTVISVIEVLESRRRQNGKAVKLEEFIWRDNLKLSIQVLDFVRGRLKRLMDDGLVISFEGELPPGFNISRSDGEEDVE